LIVQLGTITQDQLLYLAYGDLALIPFIVHIVRNRTEADKAKVGMEDLIDAILRIGGHGVV
jgi:hypothetical protein